MKRTFLAMTVLFFILGLAASAGATLTNNGDGTITDDDRGDGSVLMWLQTPGLDWGYNDAVGWANSLVFAGYDDWRLPSALDFDTLAPDEVLNSTNNEFGNLYGVELGNPAGVLDQGYLSAYSSGWYWTETEDPPDDAYAFFWSWDGMWLIQTSYDSPLFDIDTELHVTAVRDVGAGPGPVPEPGTMLLLGSGLIGLVGLGRKKLFKRG